MRGNSVLIVEDNRDLHENLRLFLSMQKFETLSAFNGQEALDLLSVGSLPSAILLDLMMPVMDGYQFLAKIRQSTDSAAAQVPIILLSASPSVQDTAKEYNVRYQTKPIDLKRLLQTLNDL